MAFVFISNIFIFSFNSLKIMNVKVYQTLTVPVRQLGFIQIQLVIYYLSHPDFKFQFFILIQGGHMVGRSDERSCIHCSCL